MWEQGGSFGLPLAGAGEWPPLLSSPAVPLSQLPFAPAAADQAQLRYSVDGGAGLIDPAAAMMLGSSPMVPPVKGFGPMATLFGSLQAELGRMTAREIMDAKALAASRSHSEAERRRRQRINSHLARLRSLLPNTTKTDKASLLAEVIEHVKELKRQTSAMMLAGAVEGGHCTGAPYDHHQLVPTEADELTVEAETDDDDDDDGRFTVRATLCCEDRPDLIPDLVRALRSIKFRTRRAEIATLGGRVKNVLVIDNADDDEHVEDPGRSAACAGVSGHHRRHELVASIQEALRAVIDRKSASRDSSSSSLSKRQRMNCGTGDDQTTSLQTN